MNSPTVLCLALLLLLCPGRVAAQCYAFTHEHVDLLSLIWNSESNLLSLAAVDDTHGGTLHQGGQSTVICPESMKFLLPGGTPLGNENDPIWILPQNPYEGVPYVGISAERLPAGGFDSPLTIQLTRLEGPGHLLLWQSTSFGAFDIRIDSRDGVSPADQLAPVLGGHEHYNWGFTTSGVYRAWFQASGHRPGAATNLLSEETPFTFHVLPLKPFETWQSTNWPCEVRTNLIAAAADPDEDGLANALEYLLGLDPTQPSRTGRPYASLVRVEGQTYGALTFTRVKAVTDADYQVLAASSLSTPSWEVLANPPAVLDQGDTERVTIRDTVPISESRQRFYRLHVALH